MKNKFENDEVLAQLSKAARKTKAPKLDESIIQSAMLSKPKFGPRKFLTPALMFNLAGGAAVLAGVFVFTSPFSQINETSLSTSPEGSSLRDLPKMSLAMGDKKFTEEELLSSNSVPLYELGLRAAAGYTPSEATEYIDETWQERADAQNGTLYVYVVTDALYSPNNENFKSLGDFFTDGKVANLESEIASSSDAEGIRLLVQGTDGAMYPMVIPVNEDAGSLYTKVRDQILSDSFTLIPTVFEQ
jgi:hypothetical protein